MTDRLGLQRRSELDPEQQEQYDALASYTEGKYDGIFKTRDDAGRFLGPFGILLHTPDVVKAYIPMIRSVAKITDLDADVRETAILVVGARTGARYETYAHEPVSGFTREECDTILAGSCPDSFDDKRRLAYRIAEALGQKGPLAEDLWTEALKVLGRQQAISLVHYVGFYSYVAVLLNGFDASIPE